jgi:4-hydroxybenzoate polyprenyltransferase
MTTSVRALLVVLGSAALGGAYRAYLRATPFPPDVVRVVPLLWLAGALAGWILGFQALQVERRKLAAIVGLILNLPNTFFALAYSLGALMGD